MAQAANFSIFHFHRQFTHYVGVTPSRYVALARMRRASHQLAFNPLQRISDVAQEARFENAESFSRTFGIPYHDPATTPAKDFRCDICGFVSEKVPTNKHGVVTKQQASVASFLAFATNKEYLAGIGHRTAALEDSRLLPLVADSFLRATTA